MHRSPIFHAAIASGALLSAVAFATLAAPVRHTHAQPAMASIPVSLAAAGIAKSAIKTAPLPCLGKQGVARFEGTFPQVTRRLRANEPVTIVAVGSSSTAGAGATHPANAYPARLQAELRARFPDATINVLNRGINGEEVGDILQRLQGSVLVEKPDLVIWQLGTNTVLRDRDIGVHEAPIREGIARIRASGADLMMIDPQYAPRVIAKHEKLEEMNALLHKVARQERVAMFPRYALMEHWHDEGVGFERFVHADGLHHNDWSYACIAKLMAGMMADTLEPLLAGGIVADASADMMRGKALASVRKASQALDFFAIAP